MAPKRLGELLVARGMLSGEQLRKALQAQMIWGGHLGTNLIELGFLTEDELGEILAESHAVRYVPYAMLQEIPASVLGSIPRGLVEKYKLVPFRFDGKRLHLVMLSPQDLSAIDEISFATGFQLIPYVTPEIRLFQVLEKYYNIPRTKRYITLSRELTLRGSGRGASAPRNTPAAERTTRRDRPLPDPSILDDAAHPGAASVPAGTAVEHRPSGQRDGTVGMPAGDAAPDPAIPALAWTPPGRSAPVSPGTPSASEIVPEPVEAPRDSRDPALDRLLGARTLGEVCSALIDASATTFRRCALFAPGGEGLACVAGLSAASSAWSYEGLPPPFTLAAAEVLFSENRTFYMGPPPGGAEEATFYERFGGAEPCNVFLAPVRVNDRIALVFYGDGLDEEVRPGEVEPILTLIQKAGLALDLLALRRTDSPD